MNSWFENKVSVSIQLLFCTFAAMRIPGNKISDIKKYFYQELTALYSKEEILVLFRMAAQHINSLSHLDIHFEPDHRVLESEVLQYSFFVKRLMKGEPVQYIMGYTWFMDLKINVSPAVLIPRPETEELANLIIMELQGIENPVILDACSGSGCISLALKAYCSNAKVIGLELSEEALEVSKQNATSLSLDVEFQKSDVLTLDSWSEPLDVLVSNPPYISNLERESLSVQVRDFEPSMALFVDGPDVLLFYRKLSKLGLNSVKLGGLIALECHFENTDKVAEILKSDGWCNVLIENDLSGNPRIVYGRK
jgi:release factor glutamine methyltransferase